MLMVASSSPSSTTIRLSTGPKKGQSLYLLPLTLIVMSSSPSATTMRMGGASWLLSSNRSCTARSEFFTSSNTWIGSATWRPNRCRRGEKPKAAFTRLNRQDGSTDRSSRRESLNAHHVVQVGGHVGEGE